MFFAIPAAAQAQQSSNTFLTRNLLGTAGLIDMPSARMANDGTLSAGASYMKNIQHYNLGFQALPWLEVSFRYSGLSHFDPAYRVYWDRSFGMKLRLAEEGAWMPAIALGINDLVGTGIYSGEYLVVSKQFGDFDATFGMGWGRYGGNNTLGNPFGMISSSFKQRRPDISAAGGTPFDSFFHDPTSGLFGGVSWHTPIDGLTLSVENSSDAYRFERTRGALIPNSRWNYGVSYRLGGTILSASYLYGDTFGGAISFELDPSHPQYPFALGAPMPPAAIRTADEQREALRGLINQRDPKYVADIAHTRNRNGFVDTVFGMRGVGDVLVSGDTLSVTLSDTGNAQALCRDVAQQAGFSGTKISRISVRSAAGAATADCAVPRVLQANASMADFAIAAGQLRFNRPILIDAADVRPAADMRAAERKFRADAEKQSIKIDAVQFAESVTTVYYENYQYLHEYDVLERLAHLLMTDAPPSIEQFRLVAVRSGVPQQEYHILRGPAERAMGDDQESPSIFNSPVSIQSAPMENPILAAQRPKYPSFGWSLFPQLHEQLFDPNNPLGLQLVAVLAGAVDLAPGLQISAGAEANIFETFRTDRPSDSVLPHVRTDYLNYFTEGKNGIGWLTVNYRTRLTPEFYATVKAGYLESMFAGAGGEVLYRPDGARWAIGADIYEVWQRDYDRLFGLRNYHATTGHVTLYWDSPFFDLNFQLRAGQYLAGDRGLTLQITRRFSTGIEIGAFATKTNVSAAQFGEGSFDKGIIIRIPLGWAAPINSQNQVPLDIRPVQRDGGQALLGDATLYDETRTTSQSEFVRNGKTFAK